MSSRWPPHTSNRITRIFRIKANSKIHMDKSKTGRGTDTAIAVEEAEATEESHTTMEESTEGSTEAEAVDTRDSSTKKEKRERMDIKSNSITTTGGEVEEVAVAAGMTSTEISRTVDKTRSSETGRQRRMKRDSRQSKRSQITNSAEGEAEATTNTTRTTSVDAAVAVATRTIEVIEVTATLEDTEAEVEEDRTSMRITTTNRDQTRLNRQVRRRIIMSTNR